MYDHIEEDDVSDDSRDDDEERRIDDLLPALFHFINRADSLFSSKIENETPHEEYEAEETELPAIFTIECI